MQDIVLILDFGSQYTQLIGRRIRELEVYCEIHPYFVEPSKLKDKNIKAIIFSGGPASVTDKDAPNISTDWFNYGVPILGICYGLHLIAHHNGGFLSQSESREYGMANIEIVDNSPLFKGFKVGEVTPVWMSHGDHVTKLPEGYKLLAQSNGAPIAVFSDKENKVFGIQFHPEVMHTKRGMEIISNFIFEISKVTKNWTPKNFIEETVESIKKSVPADSSVICGLSGGVDSTVSAVLVNKAIGDRLHCILVDHGLMRQDEAKATEKRLGKEGLGLNLTVIDASQEFLSELKGVTDPEQKRKIIGRVFIEIFEREAKKIFNATHLVQGTLYPDVIESVSVRGPSVTIKSHHNVGGLPEKMNLKLIEPLRELFKDEVRRIGHSLEIPAQLIERQPFPGPGLGVRILGDITKERADLLRHADAVYLDEIRKAGLYNEIWQSFAVLLPIKSVGVQGDNRTYDLTIALRAVTSQDGMTADWYYFPEDVLRKISTRIMNEVKGINRVVMDISSKPPATIEWE